VQEQRFRSRLDDPMRRWKLSDTDLQSITRWEDYSRAKDEMFEATDHADAPWWTIESDDKRASRLNAISHLLSQIPYEQRAPEPIDIPERPGARRVRPTRARTVPVRAGSRPHARALSIAGTARRGGGSARVSRRSGHPVVRGGRGPDPDWH
ncbi:hypothetical protein QT572_22495, partial [Xanthomonas citri pv. citri]